MKISAQILVTATTLSGLAAAAPEGYLQPYSVPECAQAGDAAPVQFGLPVNDCVEIEAFSSFEAGFSVSCAKGKTPMVTAYSGTQCTGNSVNAGTLPADQGLGDCAEILVVVSAGTVSVEGRSALFQCI